MAGPRILVGYSYFPSSYQDVEVEEERYLRLLRNAGFDVEGFCLTLNPPGPHLSFADLDARWRRGDPELLAMYEILEARLEGKDVLINESGINLHPEFVERLPVFTVFQCFDDPESSDQLSKPAASAYDLCLVGNIAEVGTYRDWGVKNAVWRPHGLYPGLYDPSLTAEGILNGERDVDLFMMGDRLSPWRKPRMDKFAAAFPDAHFYGNGWPRGYLSKEDELRYLRRSKIGPNLHNSTGPINVRTFYLPANGVMQICDNKSQLGKIFELGQEVAGFDTVEEGIDLCRYYLAHDDERRRIAAGGWTRAVTQYNETAVFGRIVAAIEDHRARRGARRKENGIAVLQRRETRLRRLLHVLPSQIRKRAPRRLKFAVRRILGLVGRGRGPRIAS